MDYSPKHPVSICPLCNQPIDEELRNQLTSLFLRPKPLLILYELIRVSPEPVNHEYFGLRYLTLATHINSIRIALKEVGSPWKILTKQNEGYYAEKDLD